MPRFEHPWVLCWLLAAVVPIWLQWRRRRPLREIDWAAMELLRRALRRQQLRWRLQDLLLLLLRTGTIFILVLALAKPRWSPAGKAGGWAEPIHHLLMFDGSFSMQTMTDGTSRFERARQQALSLIDRQPAHDRFSVWLADPLPRPVLFPPSSNHRDVRRSVAALQPTAQRSDWSRLPEVLDHYHFTSTMGMLQGWLLTDMQRGTGLGTFNSTSAAWQRWRRRVPLQIIDVGDGFVDNLAVMSLVVPRGRAILHEPCVIVSEIHNHSPGGNLNTEVTLFVNGTAVARQSLRVPPQETVAVTFTHLFHRTGTVELRVQTEGDQLAIDDQRFGVMEVVDRVPVVCVGGTRDDIAYVASALEAEGTDGTRFRVQRVSLDQARGPFTDADVVVVCHDARITTADVRRWMEHVRDGGGLLVFLGGDVDEDSDVRAWTAATLQETNRPFLPAEVGPVQRDGSYSIDADSIVHSWLQRLADSDVGGLRSIPIWRYVQLDPRPDAERLLTLTNGAVALVGHRVGDGYVLLCGTPASVSAGSDMDWNALPVWPSFPPLLRELVWFVGQPRSSGALVGERIDGQFQGRVTDIEIQPPPGNTASFPSRQVTNTSSDGDSRWEYAATDAPGIYHIKPLDKVEPPRHVPVNVDCQESNLTRLDQEELLSLRSLATNPTWISNHGSATAPWQRWSLLLVLACLLAEPLWQSRSVMMGAGR